MGCCPKGTHKKWALSEHSFLGAKRMAVGKHAGQARYISSLLLLFSHICKRANLINIAPFAEHRTLFIWEKKSCIGRSNIIFDRKSRDLCQGPIFGISGYEQRLSVLLFPRKWESLRTRRGEKCRNPPEKRSHNLLSCFLPTGISSETWGEYTPPAISDVSGQPCMWVFANLRLPHTGTIL